VIVLGHNVEGECVRSLDEGAADYVTKPFNVQELLARIRAVLRTSVRADAGVPPEPEFRSGDLTIDFSQRLVSVAGAPVQLSRTEYKLLRALAQQAGRVLSHDTLLERVWGPGYGGEVEFLWVYVRRLRRKLEPDPKSPRYILTIPGVGYRLAQL
jgi:DNA-binding response OmpR family regulator